MPGLFPEPPHLQATAARGVAGVFAALRTGQQGDDGEAPRDVHAGGGRADHPPRPPTKPKQQLRFGERAQKVVFEI